MEARNFGIFGCNLNSSPFANGSSKFSGFLVQVPLFSNQLDKTLERKFVEASTPKLGEWTERWDSREPCAMKYLLDA